jgi:radical SAM superfamily enzyme YgiQ (UPF0313 family)
MRLTLLLVAPPVLYAGQWWGNRTANKPHFATLAGAVRDLADVGFLELDRDLDTPLETHLETLDRSVDDTRPSLVGISCWSSMHYLGAVAVIERLRATSPDIGIVVGGHHASAVPEDFDGLADWVVIGDGEGALAKLCAERPARPDKTEHLRPPPERTMDPAAIDWVRYGANGSVEPGGVVWLLASRGCPFQCRYCMEPLRGPSRSSYTVEATLTILDGLMRTHAPKAIAFADPLFGANRGWTAKLLDGLIARNWPVTYWAQTRADVLTRELLERFAAAGFKLDFGLDTGSLDMATLMQKSPNPARYLARSTEMLHAADEVGLHHGVYLLFNYPGETRETAAATRHYIEALAQTRGPMSGWLSAQTFFILPGTESYRRMARDHERFGSLVRHPDWWRKPGDHYALATDILPSRDYLGREAELAGFNAWAHSVNATWSSRYSDAVRTFCQRFYGG